MDKSDFRKEIMYFLSSEIIKLSLNHIWMSVHKCLFFSFIAPCHRCRPRCKSQILALLQSELDSEYSYEKAFLPTGCMCMCHTEGLEEDSCLSFLGPVSGARVMMYNSSVYPPGGAHQQPAVESWLFQLTTPQRWLSPSKYYKPRRHSLHIVLYF